AEQGIDARQLGPLSTGLQELLEVLREEGDAAAAPILEPEGEAARVAQAWNRRRRESEGDSFGNAHGKRAVQLLQEAGGLQFRFLSLSPVLELDEEEGV